jgi:hypothetical protein
MFRLTFIYVIVASMTFVGHVSARRPPSPIEVTGTIKMFDRTNHVFTIEVDESTRILIIAEGHECKFIQNGEPADEHILKKGARVKVSYFSTIFTGKIAVKIESNAAPKVRSGIILQRATRHNQRD